MAITPIAGTVDKFDPLDELLNSRIAEANAADAKLLALLTQDVRAYPTVTNANFTDFGFVAFRIGHVVHLRGSVEVKTANYLATTTKRALLTLPPGYRPSTSIDVNQYAMDPGSPAITRTTRLTGEGQGPASHGQLFLSTFVSSAQGAATLVYIDHTFLTFDPHPSL